MELTQEQKFKFRYRMEQEAEQATGQPAPEPTASLGDKMAGSWGGRMLQGMASPALAAIQMVGGDTGREIVSELDAMRKRGMKAEGNEGFDAYGLLGSLLPGAGIAKGVTAALPAATSLMGKIGTGAAIGGATAAAQPVAPSPDFWSNKAQQVGIGAGAGSIVPALGSMLTAARGAPRLNPVQAQTLQEGQQAGYVVPPSSVNPSFLNNRLESLAGKAAVGQEAAKRNQEVTNALTAKELGLPPGASITERALKDIRTDAGNVYKQVDDLRSVPTYQSALPGFPQFTKPNLLAQLKEAQADARIAYKSNTVTPHPDMLARAKAAEAKAHELEGNLEGLAKAHGRNDLIDALREARVKIAKTYDVERALNVGDENVSAPIIGRQLDKAGLSGKSGEFVTIGKMEQAFPSAMREGARVPASGVSGTDAAAGAILGTLGYGAGGPAGLLAAGLPLLRGPARNLVLSKGYQKFATADPSRFQAIIDELSKQGAGAAGTAAGRGGLYQ